MKAFYRIAIIAHPEYRADDPVWQCFQKLSCAGHAVEILDPMHYENLLDGNNKPNIDTLKKFIERFQPDVICVNNYDAQAILKEASRNGTGSTKPFRHFVVFGYVGKQNFGDELIFSTICDELKERYPNSYVSLIGHDQNTALQTQGVTSITCNMKLEADIMLDGAAALIFMAGIMFDQPFNDWSAGPIDPFVNPNSEIGGQTAFTLMARLHGVPAVFLGIGAGPLSNPDAHRLVCLSAANDAQFITRDCDTTQLLLNVGIPESQVHTKADLAHLATQHLGLKQHKNMLPNSPYIAVSLREHSSVDEDFTKRVAAALDQVWEEYHLKALFIDAAPEDRNIHQHVLFEMKHKEAGQLLKELPSISETVAAISSSSLALAMRLHVSIVANINGIPSVGINYNPKVGSYYEQESLGDYLVNTSAQSSEIYACIKRAIGNTEQIAAQLRVAATSNTKLACESFDLLDAYALDAPVRQKNRIFYSRSTSTEECKLQSAMTQLNDAEIKLREAQRTIESLQNELVEIKSSTTWKAGSAITALPRSLKDKLSD